MKSSCDNTVTTGHWSFSETVSASLHSSASAFPLPSHLALSNNLKSTDASFSSAPLLVSTGFDSFCRHSVAYPPSATLSRHPLPTPRPWAVIDMSPFHSAPLGFSEPSFAKRGSCYVQPTPIPPTERSCASSHSLHSLKSSESSRSESEGESAKSKRSQIRRACVHCRQHKIRCEEQRPCGSCVRTGRASTCVDFVPANPQYASRPSRKSESVDCLGLSDREPRSTGPSAPGHAPTVPVQLASPVPALASFSPIASTKASSSKSPVAACLPASAHPFAPSLNLHSLPLLPLSQPASAATGAQSFSSGSHSVPPSTARQPWYALLGPIILEVEARVIREQRPLPLHLVTAMAWIVGYVMRRISASGFALPSILPIRTPSNSAAPTFPSVELPKTDLPTSSMSGTAPASDSLSPASSLALLSSPSTSGAAAPSPSPDTAKAPSSAPRISSDSQTNGIDILDFPTWMGARERMLLSILSQWRISDDRIDSILKSSQQPSSLELVRTCFEEEQAQTHHLPFGVIISPLNPTPSLSVRTNECLARLLGYNPSQLSNLMNQDPSRVFSATSLDRMDVHICRMILKRDTNSTFNVATVAADGNEVRMVQSVVIKGIDGMPQYSVSFLQLRPDLGGMVVGGATSLTSSDRN